MAKIVGFVGTASGRSGNFVYAKGRNGMTIQRAYQPQVKNPRTIRQQASREKFTRASEMVAIWAQALKVSHVSRGDMTAKIVRGDAVLAPDTSGVLLFRFDELAKTIAHGPVPMPAWRAPRMQDGLILDLGYTLSPNTGLYLEDGDRVGVVLCAYNASADSVIFSQSIATDAANATATLPVPGAWAGNEMHVVAFLKVVPKSYNQIPTVELPWKFPSNTSDAVYLGTVLAE